MKIDEISFIVTTVLGSLLLLSALYAFIHFKRQRRFDWILHLIVLMIVQDIGIILVYAFVYAA